MLHFKLNVLLIKYYSLGQTDSKKENNQTNVIGIIFVINQSSELSESRVSPIDFILYFADPCTSFSKDLFSNISS